MKKIISSAFLASILLVSCGGNKDDVIVTPVDPEFVVGIGKVLPEGGIVNLSVTSPSKVVKIYKQLGDQVKVGDVLFDMEAVSEKLQVDQSKASLYSAEENIKALSIDINSAELKLAKLKRDYETSKRLLVNKAETPQKVFQDSIAYMEQKLTLDRQKQNFLAQKAALNEQRIALNSKQVAVNDKSFKALQDGILIRYDISVGTVLNANSVFGELAPLTDLVIEGELDELYANRLALGQSVELNLVGQTDVIAKGNLDFVGSSLQNKSIIYETIGEASDRRVRRFTVKITEGANLLLINQKVECKIHLK